MPLYEYHCTNCEHDCELLIRGEEKPVCPACGGKKLQKLLSVPAAHTAGSPSSAACSPMPRGGCGAPQCGMGMGGCSLD